MLPDKESFALDDSVLSIPFMVKKARFRRKALEMLKILGASALLLVSIRRKDER